MQIDFIGPEHAARDGAEAHVRAVYRDTYGAEVRAFAPLLVSATNGAGRVVCVAGIRTASDGFFSKVYVDRPLDRILSDFGQGSVTADAVMEVVSLASTSPFPVLPVLDAIITWGRSRRIGWGIFTATAPLRRLLGRAGMMYAEICPARAERLSDSVRWGSYYLNDPWVCAFNDSLRRPLVLSRRAALQTASAS